MLIGGNSPTQGYTDRARAAATVFGPGVMLWLASAGPQDALKHPGCVHIVRLDNWTVDTTPSQYAAMVAPQVTRWRSAVPDAIFAMGNEPDIEADHNGEAVARYAATMKARFPGIAVANPPLSVANTSETVFDGCDACLIHTYWGFEAPSYLTDPRWGRNYLPFLGKGVPVYIGEVNASPANLDTATNWTERNRQLAQWLDQAAFDGVAGACFFILDASLDWAGFDVGPEAAADILAHRAPPAPPPPPPPQTPDYLRYRGLSYAQYTEIVERGAIPGLASPMDNRVDYDALIGVMREKGIDPRLPLAFTWSEGHDGSDPGLVAARVNNLGGIKYVGAPGTYDSGIPADTGGTYAGFYDLRPYYTEWARIMNNAIIGPSFRAGDLITAVEHYTNGPGTGHNKVDKYREYVAAYQETPDDPPAARVSGADIAAEALSQLGQVRSGTYDTRNGDHPWYLWCQSFIERVHEHRGVIGPFYASAADCGRAMVRLGLMRKGPAPRGAVMFWDESFWADGGHTALALGDGTFAGTTDQGIAIRSGWETSPGYMGWAFRPGVGATPIEEVDVIVDGHLDDAMIQRLWYGAATAAAKKKMAYNPGSGIGQRWKKELLAGHPLGAVQSGEESDKASGRVIQYFTNGCIVFYTSDGSTSVN